jgi:hypothetical protein
MTLMMTMTMAPVTTTMMDYDDDKDDDDNDYDDDGDGDDDENDDDDDDGTYCDEYDNDEDGDDVGDKFSFCSHIVQVKQHAELAWILGCMCTLPRLEHLPQWKVCDRNKKVVV